MFKLFLILLFYSLNLSAQKFSIIGSTDLGEIILGEEKLFSIQIHNPTDKDLVVELINHCGCVRLNEPAIQIASKGNANFTGIIYSSNVRGTKLKQEIILQSKSGKKIINLTGTIKKAYHSPSIFVLGSNLKGPKPFKVFPLKGFPQLKSISFSNKSIGVNFLNKEQSLELSINSSLRKKGLQGYLLFTSTKEDFPVIRFPVFLDNVCKLLPMVKNIEMDKKYEFIYTSPASLLEISEVSISEGVLFNKNKINDFTWKFTLKVPSSYSLASIRMMIKNNLMETPDIRIFSVRKK